MKKSRWSDYERYLVLADNAVGRLQGTYMHFQDFKKVVEAINTLAKSQKTNILVDGELVSLQGRKVIFMFCLLLRRFVSTDWFSKFLNFKFKKKK